MRQLCYTAFTYSSDYLSLVFSFPRNDKCPPLVSVLARPAALAVFGKTLGINTRTGN